MTAHAEGTLGIDFGTSNSAAAWARPGEAARLLPLEGTATSLPTAIFYNAEDRATYFGREAIAQYLAGTEGRLMRSLKSLLGSPLLLEKTAINGQAVSFLDIIATFLAELRRRCTVELGAAPGHVAIGRPVHFVDDDPARDRLAQSMLLQAAHKAGFGHVSFQLEPIAAALDYEHRVDRESVVLVVDIGGGTSDFTVVRLKPQGLASTARVDRAKDVLATTGVHIGGTDFDRKLNLDNVMPQLGLRHIGPQGREVPSAVFFDLATWHLINWRYVPKAVREAKALRPDYSDLQLHDRLMRVLEERHGHRVANAVELAKIDSSTSGGRAPIDLSFLDAGLQAGIAAQEMREQLLDLLAKVVACAQECVRRAGREAGGVDAIYLTGGSSALAPLKEALRQAFPATAMVEGDLFGGVASGLAYTL
ncbi:MAG TPA: Hsp70 family protein [Burkholderiaceae bacterium]|nr:Hsp70 family protein [Burkholderiaceae bacterium]